MRRSLRPVAMLLLATWSLHAASAQEGEAEAALRAANAAGSADRAVDLYCLALDADAAAGYGVAVVESGRWLGITEGAIAGLRALAPDGVRLYRARYDERAAAAVNEARAAAEPYGALTRAYERYPIASVAPRALEAMADVAIARGHRQRAQEALSRLIEHHAAEIDAPRVRAKLAGYAPTRASTAPVIGAPRFAAKFELAGAPKRFASGEAAAAVSARNLPLVHGDHVFVATADQVLTYDVRTGEDGRRIPRMGPVHLDPNPKVQFGVAAVGSMLVVPLVDEVLRDQQYRGIPIKVMVPIRKLAAFDPVAWRWTWNHARALDGTPMERWSFASPPAAFDDAVIASAFGPPAHPMVNSYVAAFDGRTGERLWDRRVGGGDVEQTMFGEAATEPLCTPVTISGGAVYHSTSFGAVAALDASSGRPLWTTAYEVIEVRAPRGYYADPREIGWENNAPVVQSGVVVVAPMDSPKFYGFDARTGRVLWTNRRRAGAADSDMKFILGTAEVDGEGVVVLAGRDQVRCVAVRTGKLLWQAALRGRTVAGRGCVSGGVVLVPVEGNEVFVLDLAAGKRVGSFPVGASGNVTLAGEHVLVSGNGVLAVHAASP